MSNHDSKVVRTYSSAAAGDVVTWVKKNQAIRTDQAMWSVLFLAVLAAGLSAEVSPAASYLPSNEQVLAFLTESIDWYRHRAVGNKLQPIQSILFSWRTIGKLPGGLSNSRLILRGPMRLGSQLPGLRFPDIEIPVQGLGTPWK